MEHSASQAALEVLIDNLCMWLLVYLQLTTTDGVVFQLIEPGSGQIMANLG